MMPDLPSALFASAVVAAAGYVRGYGGFGFSMIAVLGLSLCFDPVRVVPVILLLEVAASLMLIGRVWHQVAWKTLGWLGIGVLLGAPAGVWALRRVAPESMKLWISLVMLLLAGLLRTGYRLRRMPGRATKTSKAAARMRNASDRGRVKNTETQKTSVPTLMPRNIPPVT